MSKSDFPHDGHQMGPKAAAKKHRKKRKTYWCAPRKVRSMNNVENVDNLTETKEKSSKKRHKKTRKIIRKVRRIDILAQPKTAKHKPKLKNHSSNVVRHTRACKITKSPHPASQGLLVRPRKGLKIKKFNHLPKVRNKPTTTLTLKGTSPIVLPKKIGVRLFSLVKKKLGELEKL